MVGGGNSFPSAKEALKKRRAEEEKKKRQIPDMSHVDKVTGVESTPSASIEPSLAKSLAKRVNWSEEGGFVTLALLVDTSAYLNPSFLQSVAYAILLPADRKRLGDWACTGH